MLLPSSQTGADPGENGNSLARAPTQDEAPVHPNTLAATRAVGDTRRELVRVVQYGFSVKTEVHVDPVHVVQTLRGQGRRRWSRKRLDG